MQTNNNNSSDVLNSLKCPITHELFRDPVIGSDGHTYERENIISWIEKHGTSPITRQPMDKTSLRSNYIVKKMVDEFLSLSSEKQYQFRLDVDVCKVKQQPLFKSLNKTIYEAKWLLKSGPPIVLIRLDGTKAKREASFYVQLSCHPHIVRTYGLVDCYPSNSIMLVQEYAPDGDLRELLRNKNFHASDEILIEIFCQIVDAMICLADNQIIHGDLACRNVLVFQTKSSPSTKILVKLTDFGLTRVSSLFAFTDLSSTSSMSMIPVRHAAPELLLDASPKHYSEKSDVFSFGVLMWEACSQGATPYENLKQPVDVQQEKLKGKLLERPSQCSNEIWNLILHCVQQDLSERPTFKSVQEVLFQLRYEHQRKSSIRISTVDCSSDRTSQMNNYQNEINSPYYKEQTTDQDDHFQQSNNLTSDIYYNNFSKNFLISRANKPAASLCEYYVICEYCSQSINTDDAEKHPEICRMRRLVKSFAKMVAQLPPIEIILCQYCLCLFPLNMIDIHQKTCYKISNNLYNGHPTSEQPSMDAYATMNYLKPIPCPNRKIETNDPESIPVSNKQIAIPRVNGTKFDNPSNRFSEPNSPANNKPTKPSSGLRRVLTKVKKRLTTEF